LFYKQLIQTHIVSPPKVDQIKEIDDARRGDEINTQVRQLETKVEAVKRKIEDEKRILDSLRETADAQNAIVVLQEQCERDFEGLEEALREEASAFQRFNLQPNHPLPKDDNDNGDSLIAAVQNIGKGNPAERRIGLK